MYNTDPANLPLASRAGPRPRAGPASPRARSPDRRAASWSRPRRVRELHAGASRIRLRSRRSRRHPPDRTSHRLSWGLSRSVAPLLTLREGRDRDLSSGAMARRLSSPDFVGRSDELARLLSTADLAASGVASIVLIGGEAGIGKSRLLAEVATRLRETGWLDLEGGSVALGDDGLPFGPIVEAMRALVRSVDAATIADAAGPSLPELSRLVPELSGVPADPSAAAAGSEWLQTRIFEGMLRLLGRLGQSQPVLLVVEDLHWADRSTRDLLAYLARNGRDERLLIVGHLPHRRAPSTPPADGLAGRSRASTEGRPVRPCAIRPG